MSALRPLPKAGWFNLASLDQSPVEPTGGMSHFRKEGNWRDAVRSNGRLGQSNPGSPRSRAIPTCAGKRNIMKRSIKIARLGGIEVNPHLTFLIIRAWIALNYWENRII